MLKNYKLFIFILLALCLGFMVSCASQPVGENLARVTFQFECEGQNMLTFWRKFENGQKGARIHAGVEKLSLNMNRNDYGKYNPHTILLEPGLYYLDSFQVNLGNGRYYVSEDKYFTKRNGWDDQEDKPFYLSFYVAEGQELVLPKVNILVHMVKRKPICYFKFEDKENIFQVGNKVLR